MIYFIALCGLILCSGCSSGSENLSPTAHDVYAERQTAEALAGGVCATACFGRAVTLDAKLTVMGQATDDLADELQWARNAVLESLRTKFRNPSVIRATKETVTKLGHTFEFLVRADGAREHFWRQATSDSFTCLARNIEEDKRARETAAHFPQIACNCRYNWYVPEMTDKYVTACAAQVGSDPVLDSYCLQPIRSGSSIAYLEVTSPRLVEGSQAVSELRDEARAELPAGGDAGMDYTVQYYSFFLRCVPPALLIDVQPTR